MPEQRTGDDAPPRPEDFDIPTIDELDAIRTAYNLSQKELSRRAGMEPGRFHHILQNDVDPQTGTMRAFLDVLKEAEPRGPEDVARTGPKPAPSTLAETLEETDADDIGEPSVRTDGSGTSERSEDDIARSPAREFGHTRSGYAVEFNLDGACACRTLTMETRDEADTFKRIIESEENISDARVVVDR